MSGKVILLGDFNIHVDVPSKSEVTRFLSSVEGTGFQQHVVGPTHKSGHTLDLVISREDDDLVKDCVVGTRPSDHHIILFKLNTERPEVQKEVIISRKVKDINPEAFHQDFFTTLTSLGKTSNDVNSALCKYEKAAKLTLDKHAPLTKRTCSQRIRQPWYTSDIHIARRVRRKHEKIWRKTRLEVHHQLYLNQNKVVNTLIDDSKKLYLRDKLYGADTKSTFRTVNVLLNNNNKILPTNDSLQCLSNEFAIYFKEKVEKIQNGLDKERSGVQSSVVIDKCNQSVVFCELSEFQLLSEDNVAKLIKGFAAKNCLLDCIPTWFVKDNLLTFVPTITTIVNMSLSTGVFPDELKHAIISPIIKKPSLDCNIFKNYRPISNIKFMSKIIERHVVNSITDHMREFHLGEPLQSAYRVAHSTETALLKVKDDIMTSIHNQKGVFLVLLDLSAAFDTVTHNILFDRMEKEIGLKGSALTWLKSYFTGRTTSVCVNGVHSPNCSLDYGLPQGSIVGPLSFTVYTLPIGRIIQEHGLSYHLYADDVQLYISFEPSSSSSIESALSTLTKCINDIQSWMTLNMLKLNNDKTEFFVALSSYNQRRMPTVKLQVGNDVIEPSQTVRNLGVIFDSQMSMTNQVSSLKRSITFHLRNISRIRRYLDFETCNNVVRSLILSRLDYGNILLMGSNVTEIARLQVLQNWAAKIIFQASKKDHASPLLTQLHWLPVKQRLYFKVMCYVYKCLADLGPAYLTSCLTLFTPSREGLRSATDTTRLLVPRIRTRTLKSAADKAFSFHAPNLWNQLPISVRTSTSLPVFKRGLKTHLFSNI
jgi:hypothetical protein